MKKRTNQSEKIAAEDKKPRHFSITTKWVSLVGLTIAFTFMVFSVTIYTLIQTKLMQQERAIAADTINIVENRLVEIPDNLMISNVVTNLSPETKRVIEGKPAISGSNQRNVFDDSVLSSLSKPDLTLVVFNKAKEVVFSSKEINVKERPSAHFGYRINNRRGRNVLTGIRPVVSAQTGKLTGYIMAQNEMNNANSILAELRLWTIVLSVSAILVTIVLSYLVVRGILRPIKLMSKVAKTLDDAPESDARIPDLKRNDELGELTLTFNQMLDRMQSYTEQQKNFVGDVSHELRTPVAVIEGHLNLLNRWGKDDPEVLDESIKASIQEVSRMKHLIQEMLDLTRAEQIDILYPDEVTKVEEVVHQVVDNIRLVHPDFEIQLDDDLEPNTNMKIYRNHLEQILIILMDNAIKYSTTRNEIIISAASNESTVNLVVQDFGEGISREDKEKIFGRFYRVDKARTREKGGNGLGLPIAKKLVESYHGTITVDSLEGSGSQFKISFPRNTK
ncbi:two-component system histidine kinase [Amylolactobacillus amylotrophicus DSM 20534]|uniref:Signal transduction histidine-protein kinase ArlS n=2 Tax=Amylolactobacillus TaxID=2767876 RepID=A0A0R1YPB8_9LACO|nr:HAMP domain-containing histidine kinase [Amylolactobacillus amylophilus]KRK37255.1 two-component system histidine kinase [Amylolactobacillus amylotrophicus DSM 20534]KRM41654.1 two-component system histidine kinase [Amylolactobacillus amylophilus DSM 20533 = JCM 1125]GED80747.1 two-component sensor histidine kinase [Amylolactobacillus amylophilus]